MTLAPSAVFPAVRYRADVDGLRAVAVLAVLAYHAFPRWAPGGYAGVDVFFVISGFLISGLIWSELAAGTFSFEGFYARRVRRLIPALATVLIAMALVGWFVLFEDEYQILGRHITESAAFVLNLALWRETGYFEPAADLKPLLHLWSLGVEEQFYLVWPIMLWLACRWRIRGWLPVVFLGAASLVLCVLATRQHSVATFYLTPARLWEFAAGALAGCSSPPSPASKDSGWTSGSRLSASLLGVALLGLAFFAMTDRRPYPGAWALLPVAGTFLLIVAGQESFVNRVLLSRKPVVLIGLISYPLYLWHWPLLVLARLSVGQPSRELKILLLALAFLLAWATWYWIETPIRVGRSRRGLKLVVAVVGLAAAAGCSVLMQYGRILPRLYYANLDIAAARKDWAYPNGGGFFDKTRVFVTRINGTNPRAVLLVGDSHIGQYWSRLDYLHRSGRRSGTAIFATSNCPPLPFIERLDDGTACFRLFDQAMALARDPEVEGVVFGALWEGYMWGHFRQDVNTSVIGDSRDQEKRPLKLGSPSLDTIFMEFESVVRTLRGSGKHVTIILSNPTSPLYDPRAMVATRWGFAADVVQLKGSYIQRRDYEAFVEPIMTRLRTIARKTGAEVIDPIPSLCGSDKCFTTSAGRPLYMDSNHVRSSYVRNQFAVLDDLLPK